MKEGMSKWYRREVVDRFDRLFGPSLMTRKNYLSRTKVSGPTLGSTQTDGVRKCRPW